MSLIGKGASSLRKKDVKEQKSLALGFKKIRFAHKASAGEAGINLTALVQPSEMATYGFTNPTVGELSRANISIYRANLKLMSSLKGMLIDQLSYTVASGTQINFIDFTAEEGEIFTGWIDETAVTSNTVVDGQQIVASGILLAGQTDFNIGTPIVINQNPSTQHGAVMVFADRGLQYRKVGNVSTGDGDYIEVAVPGGLGSLLRFTPSGVDRFITVLSNGVIAERPDGSMMAAIERVQGQIDQMVPTLADVAGVPETTFQTAPNSVDLKQFGDLVLEHETEIADHETRLDNIQVGPTYQVITSGSGTFNVAAGAKWLKIKMAGGGGGGEGSGTGGGPGSGGNGTNTTFGSIAIAGGGFGANNDTGGAGGTYTLGVLNGFGQNGGEGTGSTALNAGGERGLGGFGGETPFFGGGGRVAAYNQAASPGRTNSGGGGQGGGTNAIANVIGGGGGGSGAYVEFTIPNPDSSYSYSVGTGGAGGPSGPSGTAGAAGGSGVIIIETYF